MTIRIFITNIIYSKINQSNFLTVSPRIFLQKALNCLLEVHIRINCSCFQWFFQNWIFPTLFYQCFFVSSSRVGISKFIANWITHQYFLDGTHKCSWNLNIFSWLEFTGYKLLNILVESILLSIWKSSVILNDTLDKNKNTAR